MQKIKIKSLKNQKDFDSVNANGKKFFTEHFLCVRDSLLSAPKKPRSNLMTINNSLFDDKKLLSEDFFLGLKLSKKLGKAVTRNKIRRRVKSMFRYLLQYYPQQLRAKAMIIIPRKSFISTDYQRLLSDLEKVVRN